jgi:hypothetical protein
MTCLIFARIAKTCERSGNESSEPWELVKILGEIRVRGGEGRGGEEKWEGGGRREEDWMKGDADGGLDGRKAG